MKKKVFVQLVTWLFVMLFFYSGVTKLVDLASFRVRLNDSPLPVLMLPVLQWFVPMTELFVGVLLIIPRYRFQALLFAQAMLVIFTMYLLYLLSYPQILCGCGGFLEGLSPGWHIVLNLAFIILGIPATKNNYSVNRITAKSL